MNASDFTAMLPLFVLGAGALLSLLASAFIRKPWAAAALSAGGMAAAFALLPGSWALAPTPVGIFLLLDRFSLFAMGLAIAASLFTVASAAGTRGGEGEHGGHFSLLALACLGACVMSSARGFSALFLGLELLSVSLFALISWKRESVSGNQAGIAYLVLSGVSSAFLLFGMALAYRELGTMELSAVADSLGQGRAGPLLAGGIGLMAVGIGFKIGAVPFHFWTPDVYAGAPAHVAGFLATVSKGAAVVILVRLFGPHGIGSSTAFGVVFTSIAGATMIVGNFLALRENNVKRILAFSSIAQFGYLLVAFLAGGSPAVRGTTFFLAAYFVSTLAAFSSVSALTDEQGEAERLEDYRGLAGRKPWLAACFTVSLLSLAGLPLTSGFMGKFILITAGEGAFLWTLAVLIALNSAVSLFYYLKIISIMFQPLAELSAEPKAEPLAKPLAELSAEPLAEPVIARASVHALAAAAIVIAVLAVLALGIFPAPLMDVIETL
jgi:NADH-quinone oxidoreductase subunit N